VGTPSEVNVMTTEFGACRARASDSTKHYEGDERFFDAFLGGYKKYGSGYFAPGDSFERAVVRMLDRAIDSSMIPDDRRSRVLDVGSGWGSLFRRLHERLAGSVEYHQVNPSEPQRRYIADCVGRAAHTYDTGLESADLGSQAYDAVFVHDSFCHLADKSAMLGKIGDALTPNGRLVVQDTFFAAPELFERHRRAKTTRFIQDEIFGFAEILPVEVLISDAAAAGLRVVSLEDVSDHYRRTVVEWIARLDNLDPAHYPLRDRTLRMLRHGASCLGYTTLHYLAVFAPFKPTQQTLRATLRELRSASRPSPAGAVR
jgi:cyclopropane-fatty-acyl-phospholipid synthase